MGAQSPYNNQRENGEPCPQTGLKEAVPLHEIPALIIDLTIILVIAAGTTLLCKKIHLPSVLGYILAGISGRAGGGFSAHHPGSGRH